MEMPAPDPRILAKKARLVERLLRVLPPEAVIHDIAETRAYECDALTAYRCPPLAAVLPSSTVTTVDAIHFVAARVVTHDATVVPAGRPDVANRPDVHRYDRVSPSVPIETERLTSAPHLGKNSPASDGTRQTQSKQTDCPTDACESRHYHKS
jgi:hypothetical protein